jgi:hypothetical protein
MPNRLGLFAVALTVTSIVSSSRGSADELEATHCFAGMGKAFHESQDLAPLASFAHNGILKSTNQRLDNMATHCEGVQRGTGPSRLGYVVCKLVDADGHIIVVADQYSGMRYPLRFSEGTGKWKGIKGQVDVEPAGAASKPAVAGSYHTCTKWKGSFQIP